MQKNTVGRTRSDARTATKTELVINYHLLEPLLILMHLVFSVDFGPLRFHRDGTDTFECDTAAEILSEIPIESVN